MPSASQLHFASCRRESSLLPAISPLVGRVRMRLGRHCWSSSSRQTWRRIPKYRNLKCLAPMYLHIQYRTLHTYIRAVEESLSTSSNSSQRVALSGLWNQGRFHGVTLQLRNLLIDMIHISSSSHPLVGCPLAIIIKFQLVHFG